MHLFISKVEISELVVLVKVSTDVFESNESVWNDDIYPYLDLLAIILGR